MLYKFSALYFRSDHSLCAASVHNWGIASSDSCECVMIPTMSYITNECPLAMLSGGGLQRLHIADEKIKVKFPHTRYRALGPELIPVYRQSAGR